MRCYESTEIELLALPCGSWRSAFKDISFDVGLEGWLGFASLKKNTRDSAVQWL